MKVSWSIVEYLCVEVVGGWSESVYACKRERERERAGSSERERERETERDRERQRERQSCLLYTSDAADEVRGVDLGGRRIIKKIFFFSSRRRHTRFSNVSWARRCV